jgi:hypothetical protein
VLHEQLRNVWHARKRFVPISQALNLTSQGLVLGAATVLVPTDGPRQLQSLRGRETRLLALLSAAYDKAIAPSVLGNIERAARAWSEGDDCLAYIHLAHAGLGELQDPYEAARRLFIVDSFIKAGTSPRAVFEVLGLGAAYTDTIEKLYNPEEPRVPAGSGRISGQWTRLLSWIGELNAAQVAALGAYVLRVLGRTGAAGAAFGLLFIPSPNNLRVEGEVSGVPGLRYRQNRDEALLHLTYDSPDGGQHTFAAYFHDDELRDEHGKVIGRVLPDGGVLIQSAVVSPDLVKDDEPRICPAPSPDKPGERGREYENYVKSFVNPPPYTTPSGIGFQLPNPQDDGALVYYDDCRRTNGMMADAKGPVYEKLLTFEKPMGSVIMEWWQRSGRQIAASGGRPVRWYFAELRAALDARALFDSDRYEGRARIEVVFLPWSKERR